VAVEPTYTRHGPLRAAPAQPGRASERAALRAAKRPAPKASRLLRHGLALGPLAASATWLVPVRGVCASLNVHMLLCNMVLRDRCPDNFSHSAHVQNSAWIHMGVFNHSSSKGSSPFHPFMVSVVVQSAGHWVDLASNLCLDAVTPH
jgi:hypothetical protein